MAGWSGRQASAKLRMVVLLGLGTIFFSTYILFSGPHFEPAAVPSPPLVDYESHPASLPPSSPPSSPSPNSTASKEPEQEERLPPMYPELKAAELTLPQHDEDLPFPEGKNARFIRFGNQMWGVGLNNQLFEMYVPSFTISEFLQILIGSLPACLTTRLLAVQSAHMSLHRSFGTPMSAMDTSPYHPARTTSYRLPQYAPPVSPYAPSSTPLHQVSPGPPVQRLPAPFRMLGTTGCVRRRNGSSLIRAK